MILPQIDRLFEEYEESHRNRINLIIHWIFEPLAVWALLATIHASALLFNGAMLVVTLMLLIYFASLSMRLTLSLGLIAVVFIGTIFWLDAVMAGATTYLSIPLFVVSWISLIIGHRIEGNWPSVFNNPHLIFIGPAWLIARVYRRFGINY